MSSMKKIFVSPLSALVVCVGYNVIMIGNEAIDYQRGRQTSVDSDISPHCCD